jgi:hypothetical protein
MITTAHRMESLSRAYVQAVAAQAGLNYCVYGFDYGTDLSLLEVEEVHGRYVETGQQVDVQLKSTTRAVEADTGIRYDLDVRAYDYLRAERNNPRVLILLVLPAAESDWVAQSPEQLAIRRCAYWLDLRGSPAVEASSSVRVSIPRENVLTPEALLELVRGRVTPRSDT